MAAAVHMQKDALAVWQRDYAGDPASAHIKLALGHAVYCKSLADNEGAVLHLRSDLARACQQLHDAVQSQHTSTKQHLQQHLQQELAALNQVQSVRRKLTAKGVAFEESMVAQLKACPAFTSAVRMESKDAAGKKGIDLCITDLYGTRCMLELKDCDGTLPDAALTKFYDDVAGSAERVFVFLRKGGFGSCRKLLVKPLTEVTAQGKLIIWFRGDQQELLDKLPFMLSTIKLLSPPQHCTADNRLDAYSRAINAARATLTTSLTLAQTELGQVEKRKTALQKEVRRLQEGLQQLELNLDVSEGVAPVLKKPRMLDSTGTTVSV